MPWRELNSSFVVGSEDVLNDVLELCYIPTFGGGYGFSMQEVMDWPISLRNRALEWLLDRRSEEVRSFKSSQGGGGGRGQGRQLTDKEKDSLRESHAPPSLYQPELPER